MALVFFATEAVSSQLSHVFLGVEGIAMPRSSCMDNSVFKHSLDS